MNPPARAELHAALPSNWMWRAEPRRPGPAVVFDLDGTLSDVAGRRHHLDGGRKDWNAFFDACGEDPVIDETAALLGALDRHLAVVLLTARPLRVQSLTLDWLARYGMRWDLLVMRRHGDFSSSPDAKRRAVAELRARGFELVLALDDDPRNVSMFREEGVPCVALRSG